MEITITMQGFLTDVQIFWVSNVFSKVLSLASEEVSNFSLAS